MRLGQGPGSVDPALVGVGRPALGGELSVGVPVPVVAPRSTGPPTQPSPASTHHAANDSERFTREVRHRAGPATRTTILPTALSVAE